MEERKDPFQREEEQNAAMSELTIEPDAAAQAVAAMNAGTGDAADMKEKAAVQPQMSMMSGGDVPDVGIEYPQTPFSYREDGHESVLLNSGAMSYSATDFTLPGKNGFDLVVKRYFDSTKAHDVQYLPIYTPGGHPHLYAYVNEHMVRQYGLGHGWSFGWPSIERVSYQSGSSTYVHAYLHMGDGRSFKLKGSTPTSGAGFTFEDYPLADMSLQTASGSITLGGSLGSASLSYVLYTKTGMRCYFDTSLRLVAMRDKFDNQISFRFYGNDPESQIMPATVLQIVDTTGRLLSLQKAYSTNGYYLTWSGLPETQVVRYAVETMQHRDSPYTMWHLMRVDLPEDTDYIYYCLDSGSRTTETTWVQNGVTVGRGTVTHNALTMTRNPYSRASSYRYATVAQTSDIGLTQRAVVVSEHWNGNSYDLADKREIETYAFTYHSGTMSVNTATVTKKNTVETHTFSDKGLRQSKLVRERATNTVLSQEAFTYDATTRLLTKTAVSAPFAKETTYTYDADRLGNLMSTTNALGHTTSYTYDTCVSASFPGTRVYNLPLTTTYQKDASTTIVKRNILRADHKKAEWSLVLENGALKAATRFVYDAYHRVIEERRYISVAGVSVSGNTVTDAGGQVVSTFYTYANTATTFPATVEIRGVTDADGALISSPYGAGVARMSKTYDGYGRVLTEADALGRTTTYERNGLGDAVKTTYPDGNTTQTEYHYGWPAVTTTDEAGVTMQYVYERSGRLSWIECLTNNTALCSCTYDDLNRLTEVTRYVPGGAVKSRTLYTYDSLGRVLSVRQCDVSGNELAKTATAYHDADRIVTTTLAGESGAPDVVTSAQADVLGRAVAVWPGGKTSAEPKAHTAYDYIGNAVSVTDRLGRLGRRTVDYAGRVLTATDALGGVTRSTYDALGRVTSVTDALGRTATTRYDVRGLALETTAPFEAGYGAKARHSYDACGQLVRTQSQKNAPGRAAAWRISEFTYDNRGRPIDTIAHGDGGAQQRSRSAYDRAGRRIAVYSGMTSNSTAGAFVTRYAYDTLGNLAATTDNLGQRETFTYDATGVPLTATDRNGNVTRYTYDALGRVSRETTTEPGGIAHVKTTAYAKTGQVKASANATMTVSYVYDSYGHLVSESESTGVAKSYAYDLMGNRTRFTLSRNNAAELDTTYAYDALYRLTSVSHKGALAARYEYNAVGHRTRLTHSNGTAVAYTYNDAGLVKSVTHTRGGVPLAAYTYEYTLDGNQARKTDSHGYDTAYTYDGYGRLVKETYGADALAYTYDRYNNRAAMESTGSEPYSVAYSYDGNNRLMREVKTAGSSRETTEYSYDSNGNQLRKAWERTGSRDGIPRGPGRVRFNDKDVEPLVLMEYNGLNQLVRSWASKSDVRYVYRPDGLRHSKAVDDKTTTHVWDGASIALEYNASGMTTARYLRGAGLILREQDGVRQYYHHNAHGDVTLRTDGAGNTLRRYDYDAFGVEREPETLDANPFRYCGEYYDRETKTVYLRARHYSPGTGRFTAEDSARDGSNWYAYCGGNPVAFSDPSGHSYNMTDYFYRIENGLSVSGPPVATPGGGTGGTPSSSGKGSGGGGSSGGSTIYVDTSTSDSDGVHPATIGGSSGGGSGGTVHVDTSTSNEDGNYPATIGGNSGGGTKGNPATGGSLAPSITPDVWEAIRSAFVGTGVAFGPGGLVLGALAAYLLWVTEQVIRGSGRVVALPHISDRAKELAAEATQNNAQYELCHLSPSGTLERIPGTKVMTYEEAMHVLYGIQFANVLTEAQQVIVRIMNSQTYTSRRGDSLWGVYTEDEIAARALAIPLGLTENATPDFHGAPGKLGEFYHHFHGNVMGINHAMHIWYGQPTVY